jgi:3-oxoacyl-[acyl-carrier-protein] synthase III
MTVIGHISYVLPQRALTNDELARQNPTWDMSSVASRAGVTSRRISAPDETAFDLAALACDALIGEADLELGDVDAIISCTQSPDYVMPGNAHLLHRHLGLGDAVIAFDYNLACSGYVYGLAFADSFVARGLASNVLLVTADTYSKHINPKDRSARVLFGDGAAATHVSGSHDGRGTIVAAELCSHGSDFEKFYVPAGGMRTPRGERTREETADRNGNVRSAENIHMDGMGVWAFVNSVVPGHVQSFLEKQSLTPKDIDVYVFHQASKMTLDSIAKALDLQPDRVYFNMNEVGNLVSASIPVALRMAIDDETIRPGDRVLLCGFGVGFSYGSILVQF